MSLLEQTIEKITGLDEGAMELAQKRLDYLLKPQGSLGKLEDIARQLAGMSGKVLNQINKKAVIVMCSDNGVYEEKVASFPQEVSILVAQSMLSGMSGVAVLAKNAGADLTVVDMGLKIDETPEGMINQKIRQSTSNMAKGPAMSREEAVNAIEAGIKITNQLIDNGYNLIGTGEVCISNTTTSSAILHALTGEDLDLLVGRGAGLDDEGLKRKKAVIQKAIEVNQPDPADALDVLAKVGGFEIAGMVGTYLACAARKVPVVVDGFISGAAAVVAARLSEDAKAYMIPSHKTEEPGGIIINRELDKDPMITMNMRLGEGTGCALVFSIVDAACAMMNNMGTFGDIGM